MFKNWGNWLGREGGNGRGKQEGETVVEASEDNSSPEMDGTKDKHADPHPLLQKAKGFSGYIYNFASSASKNLSESVVETAQTLKKSVEEGNINGIIDKTLLGDFQKEQEKFVQEKKAKKFGAAVPPWVGFNEEETVQQQILSLSADKRNFLRDPPAGVQFQFDFEHMYPVAMVMLEEDELLRRMRFHLVPKQVKEEAFWKNYFYRVSLIKQSAQLAALAAQQAAERRDVEKSGCSPVDTLQNGEEEISTSQPVSEFVSDAFDSCNINKDDLRKEMEQLVLDKQELPSTLQDETPDWEREIQEELKEYNVLADNQNHDDNWDKEIEDMLKEES
ncbi:synapse-associated protein 1-like [Limanda limanda]|uniref:synapse-associated protein 1-like n=1 Tax=Limanda limanda TaxID=27771 RepID=UPI0029C8CFAA|nr:synapse-associated protein 1-like [Limanda limanda]